MMVTIDRYKEVRVSDFSSYTNIFKKIDNFTMGNKLSIQY